MLKIAAAVSGVTVDCIIPPLFEDATHLLILDADTNALLEVMDGGGRNSFARSIYFAEKTVEYDCEAILCGELEAEPFAVLAEENCVTRYLAAANSVLDGIRQMNDYALPLIADFIGGTGCPDLDPANCELDDDESEG